MCSCEKTHLAVWGCVGYYHWYSQSSRLNACKMITSHIQYTSIKLHSWYFNRCYDVLKNSYDISNIKPVRVIFQKNRPSLIHIMTSHQIGAKPSLKFEFKIVYYFAWSVQLMTWILLHVLAFHPLERLQWSFAWISSLPMGLSPSYWFWWQLMWWVTNDVVVSVCGRSCLWPFRFVAVPVCGRCDLWPFRFVAVSVVAVSVCGRYDLLPWN